MLMAYQLKHERVLMGGGERGAESDETLAVALQQNRTKCKRNDLLNLQLRDFQFMLCTIFLCFFFVFFFCLKKSLSPTAGRQQKNKNCQLTQLDGSIARINGSGNSKKKCSIKRSVSVYMCVNRLCNIFLSFFN